MLWRPDETRFLLDESLAPAVATALRAVGYRMDTVNQAILGPRPISDPQIIAWADQNNAAWIHADDSARKQHRQLLLTHRVSTVWVRRPKGGMGAAQQLLVLSYALPRFIHLLRVNRNPQHCSVTCHGLPHAPGIRFQPVPL